jgi:hypothetical protein
MLLIPHHWYHHTVASLAFGLIECSISRLEHTSNRFAVMEKNGNTE